MKPLFFKLVETGLSGDKTQLLSVVFHDGSSWEDESLYDRFLLENEGEYEEEVDDIDIRLEAIGNTTGLREFHYTPNEGNPGDGLIALFDIPEKKLRLYGMAFGKTAIILGGGGPKPKYMHALQESPKLTAENDLMRRVAAIIMKAVNQKRIKVTEYGLRTTDDYVFRENDDEDY